MVTREETIAVLIATLCAVADSESDAELTIDDWDIDLIHSYAQDNLDTWNGIPLEETS